MTFEKTYEINGDNKIIIHLPESFKSKKKVRVTVEDLDTSRKEKIVKLANASKDPLFQEDIIEITKDFQHSDGEV
jgi:hypothetical protein